MPRIQKPVLTNIMLLFIAFIGCGAPSLFAKTYSMYLNSEKTLTFGSTVKEVTTSKRPKVNIVKGTDKKELIITAKKIGQTKIDINLENGEKKSITILSTKKPVIANLADIIKQLNKIPGLKSYQTDKFITVNGKITQRKSENDFNRIRRSYPEIIVDKTKISYPSNTTVVKTINRVLKENDISNIQAYSYGRILSLEGSAKDDQQKALALKIAKMIQPSIQDRISKTSLGGPAIAIEVMFIQSKKQNNKEVGFELFGSAENPLAKSIGSITFDPVSGKESIGKYGFNWRIGSLTNFLKLIQTKTVSHIMSNPKLVTRTGEPAKFHSGETTYLEQRSVNNGENTSTFIPVETGVLLDVQPIMDNLGQIDAKIRAEVSSFSPGKDGSPPSVQKSLVETRVSVLDGQTILISGLKKNNDSKSTSRVPFVSDMPLAGEAFKKRTFDQQSTELLVLVTLKRVYQNESDRQEGNKLLNDSSRNVKFSIFD